jgi:hypothetical protein
MTKVRTKENQPALFAETAAEPETKTAVATTAKPTKRGKGKGEVVKFEPKHVNLLGAIMSAAADPACQPDKIHALLDVRERLMREQAMVGYRKAYRAAKDEMPVIDKDGRIDEGQTRSGRQGKKTRFATYENLQKLIEPVLAKCGLDLSLQSEPKPSGDGILMRATLSFIATTEYGEFVYSESTVVPMPPDPTGSKNAAQAVSSALSYAKRNAVILVLNIKTQAPPDRDLDGNDPKKVEQAEAKMASANATLGAADVKKLAAAIEDCGVSVDMVLSKYEIPKLEDMRAADLPSALAACAGFKAEKLKRQQQQK